MFMVASKLKIAKSSADASTLIHEYQILQDLCDSSGIPKALLLGHEGELHVMVLTR